MIIKIETRTDFNNLLTNNGWKIDTQYQYGAGYLICPYNVDIRICVRTGTIFTGTPYSSGQNYIVLGKISNLKYVTWEFDDQTNLLYNQVFAMKIC